MLDLVGLLTTPHLYIGGILGFLAGLGAAWLVHWAFPLSAPVTLLALIVAAGCVVGLVVAARLGSGDRM
jgi:asparagine N-glycosylation enzyme membrane subunit Stt3